MLQVKFVRKRVKKNNPLDMIADLLTPQSPREGGDDDERSPLPGPPPAAAAGGGGERQRTAEGGGVRKAEQGLHA